MRCDECGKEHSAATTHTWMFGKRISRRLTGQKGDGGIFGLPYEIAQETYGSVREVSASLCFDCLLHRRRERRVHISLLVPFGCLGLACGVFCVWAYEHPDDLDPWGFMGVIAWVAAFIVSLLGILALSWTFIWLVADESMTIFHDIAMRKLEPGEWSYWTREGTREDKTPKSCTVVPRR